MFPGGEQRFVTVVTDHDAGNIIQVIYIPYRYPVIGNIGPLQPAHSGIADSGKKADLLRLQIAAGG